MTPLNQQIRIRSSYTRSINLHRDSGNSELVHSYMPTTRAIQVLEQVAGGLNKKEHERAIALVGPYGSGKSAFALFLAALLGQEGEARKAALAKLKDETPHLYSSYKKVSDKGSGFLRVVINGVPSSLSRQLLEALAFAVERENLDKPLVRRIRAASKSAVPLDQVLLLIVETQNLWGAHSGSGVLIEIDELGKILEYETYHPQHSEIHLLQLIAEHAQKAHQAPLHLLVMLHQSFDQYTNKVSRHLRSEWQKVQGRFSSIAFLEPAEQALRIVSAAFERNYKLSNNIHQTLDSCIGVLADEGAIPFGLEQNSARTLLEQCYPLHPLTTLILPVLCQKVAQNERTLFSYLGSREAFGFGLRLEQMGLGEWIEPHELYDYFIQNQAGGISDPLTYHRWVEVVSALERFDEKPSEPTVRLLKTIGLLNLIGGQRGLKASINVLQTVFGADVGIYLERLEKASVIHFRSYSQEYRVWQGSDFDLEGALQEVVQEFSSLPLVQTLNQLAPMRPIVARRASISTGTLRAFHPRFVDKNTIKHIDTSNRELRIWYYLAEDDESEPFFGDLNLRDVVALCPLAERLRETVVSTLALRELPKRHAALHQDPVAKREHGAWLTSAESETEKLFRLLFDEPETLKWFWERQSIKIESRRHLQQQLSIWTQEHCYSRSPLIRNELINWDVPSPSANTGRKRLLAAMLSSADQENLGIEKTPAEMSLYLSLLKATRLHRQENSVWGIYPPDDEDPCQLRDAWRAITKLLGNDGARQVPMTELYALLSAPPFGMKLGVLPILVLAYLLAHKREVAFYQEGAFCEVVTLDQMELLCRRPDLFALERFELAGLRGDLFDQYFSSVVGKVQKDASLLDIVRPLVRFISSLPPYTLHCKGLSKEAELVRTAFAQAKSPGVLLFDALPKACGIAPESFLEGSPKVVEEFIKRLVAVLRELKGTFDLLQNHWQEQLSSLLLDEEVEDLAALRAALTRRYQGLDAFTPDRMGLGAFIRRIVEPGHASDRGWLESVATLLAKVPQQKWKEENRFQAELRLHEISQQLRDLEKLRMASPNGRNPKDILLIKIVDTERGEFSHVLKMSDAQRNMAVSRADQITKQLDGLDASEQMAVLAILMEQIRKQESKEGDQHV